MAQPALSSMGQQAHGMASTKQHAHSMASIIWMKVNIFLSHPKLDVFTIHFWMILSMLVNHPKVEAEPTSWPKEMEQFFSFNSLQHLSKVDLLHQVVSYPDQYK